MHYLKPLGNPPIFTGTLFLEKIDYWVIRVNGPNPLLLGPKQGLLRHVFFIFAFFKKKFTTIYFWFQVLQFCTPTARQGGGRGPTARQVGGRDLYVNKNKKKICARVLGGSLPPPCHIRYYITPVGGRGPAARQGGRQAPSKDLCAKKILFLFTYKSLPPTCRAVGPLPPPCRAVGV